MLKKLIVTGLICCATTSAFAYDMFDIFGRGPAFHHGKGSGKVVQSSPYGQSGQSSQSGQAGQSWQSGQSGYNGGYQGGYHGGYNTGYQGGNNGQYNGGTTGGYVSDNVSLALLDLVANDCEMCISSLRHGAWANNVMAIGYVNNALSALRRSRVHCSYRRLVGELADRLQKVRFYLLMNDVGDARARLNQIASMVRRVTASIRNGGADTYYAQPSTGYGYNGGYTTYPSTNGGWFGGYNGSSSWGNGRQVMPVGLPSTPMYRPNS